MKTYRKYLLVIVTGLLLPYALMAQRVSSYEKEWATIDSLISKANQPKTALVRVNKLYQEVHTQKIVDQSVKALAYKYVLERRVTDKDDTENTKIIDDALAHPIDPLERSLLWYMKAGTYVNYLQRFPAKNSTWNDTLSSKDSDWSTWTYKDFLVKIYQAYHNALNDSAVLQNTSITQYPALITISNNKELRPTMYDLVVNSALDFYKTNGRYSIFSKHKQSKNAFNLTDAHALADWQTFARYSFQSADSTSESLNALHLFQRLIRFHAKNAKPDALIDIDNQRIVWVHTQLIGVDAGRKDSLYLSSLKSLMQQYPKNPVAMQSAYLVASYYDVLANKFRFGTSDSVYRYKRITALSYIEPCLTKDSVAGEGWINLQQLRERILATRVNSMRMETVSLPNEPILALLNFYHLSKAFVRIIPCSNYVASNTHIADSLMQVTKKVQETVIEIPFAHDYQNISTEIKIDPLPIGKYLLCLSGDKDGKKSRCYVYFYVSNLAYVESKGNYFVVDRKSGKPIEGVRLVLPEATKKIIDYTHSNFLSDKDGHIVVQAKRKDLDRNYWGTYDTYLYKGNDTLDIYNIALRPYVTQENVTTKEEREQQKDLEDFRKDNAKTLYFTDRNIYRPGQTVYFKAVVYTKDGDDAPYHLYQAKDTLTFFLSDVNGKTVDSLILKQDAFGAVSGSFRIPTNVLTGEFNLNNDLDFTDFDIKVEEYKRPTFYVDLDSVKATYRLNDLVKITGKAIAYNGSKVSNGKAKIHIERSARFPYYWLRRGYYSSGKDILDTVVPTDAQGKFSVDFRAIPDESVDSTSLPVFQYAITAEVTDPNGETRSKNTSVSVGYNSIEVQWNVGDKAQLVNLDDLKVIVKNLNGARVSLPVTVKISPVLTSTNIVRSKYWSQPDVQIMDSLTYKKYFPLDMYSNENQVENWPKQNPVLEKIYASDSVIQWAQKPAIGWYCLEATVTSPEGNPMKDYRYVRLVSQNNPQTNNYLEAYGTNYTATVGDTVLQYLSTAADELYLTEVSSKKDGDPAFSKMVLKNGTLPIQTIAKGATSQILNHVFAGYKENRFYNASFHISIVPKTEKLDVQIKTFRDKIEPGTKEKWSVRVYKNDTSVNNAQLLSSMYDASLDQIVKGDWSYQISNYNHTIWGRQFYFSEDNNHITGGDGIFPKSRYSLPNKQYPNLIFENGHLQVESSLDEVVLTAYGVVKNKSLSGAVSAVYGSTNAAPGASNVLLQGKVAGLQVGSDGYFNIRGISSVSGKGNPIYIVDGQILEDGAAIPPADIASITVLEGAQATALYGAQAANGAVVITTKSKSYDKKTPPPLRSNFNETAFFYPSVAADKDGNYWVEFTMPDAVTQWRWRNLAMDTALRFGYSEMMVTSQKILMIQPNMPRFLRAGDQLVLTAKVSNTGMKDLSGKAFVQLLDADSNVLHWQKVDRADFATAANQSSTVAFNMDIPEDYSGTLYVKIWAEGGKFSDGELHEIPVLSRKTLVTETLPFELKGDTTAHISFDKLLASGVSNTLQNKTLSIELATNPVWYAVQAIPYLQSFQYECSEQIFSRMYGGFLAEKITRQFPQIKSVLDKWENDSEALKSNLQKNTELKQIALEETPWLNNAESEAARKRKLALYFNKDSVDNLLQKNFDLLSKRQLSDGSFSWYDGSWGDRYITQNIVVQYAHLQSLNAIDKKWQSTFQPMIQKAKSYLSSQIEEDYKDLKKRKADPTKNQTGAAQLMYLYAMALDTSKHKYSVAENYYLQQSKRYWNCYSNVQKAWIAEMLYRNGNRDFEVNTIIKSLLENAVENPITGTYWKSSFDWGYGYLSSIETHSQIMSSINYIAEKENNTTLKSKVEAMQHWLIRNKQTNYWSNTKATADACYALLTANNKWINAAPDMTMQMGDSTLDVGKQETATGYTKIAIGQNHIKPGLGKVTIAIQNNPGYVYGGIYWQYLENIDKVTQAASPLSLQKTFYKESIIGGEKYLQEIKQNDSVKVGDKLVVRLLIKSDRDMQYVHLKDLRASDTEPDDVLSGYNYQNGLGYYLSIKDASSNFFFNTISKGTHVLEYSVHVTHAGIFASGLASIQCMYAPEMNSHSEGGIIEAK
ncbi:MULTISPECIES: alpha-2-macroglobulin family protein [Chitinophagaceae]